MAVADLPHPREVARRRRQAAARVLHGLEDHRGDGRRVPRSAMRSAMASAAHSGSRPRDGPVEVGVGDVAGAGHQRLEGRCARTEAGDAQRARASCRGRRARGRSTFDARRLAARAVVGARELQGGLDGSEPPDVKNTRSRSSGARPAIRSASSIARGWRCPGRRVGQLAGLRGGGVGQLGPAVAGVDAEQRGERVEVPAPACRPTGSSPRRGRTRWRARRPEWRSAATGGGRRCAEAALAGGAGAISGSGWAGLVCIRRTLLRGRRGMAS